MANFGQVSTYIKALGNSILPESLQTEQYTNEDFNEATNMALLKFLQDTYGDKEAGSYPVTYKDLNNYFNSQSVLNDGGLFSDAGAIKTTLGSFNVNKLPDGTFEVTDTYDFNQTDEYGRPMANAPTFGDVMSRLSPSNIMDKGFGTSLYGAARMFGGMRIPEGSANAIPIKLTYPSSSPAPAMVPPPVPIPRPKKIEEQQVVNVAPSPYDNLTSSGALKMGFGSLRNPSL
tara:strand:+ start:216 stop:908 length:693 start_codon:yes stop_codon:yes gene_type:complete